MREYEIQATDEYGYGMPTFYVRAESGSHARRIALEIIRRSGPEVTLIARRGAL